MLYVLSKVRLNGVCRCTFIACFTAIYEQTVPLALVSGLPHAHAQIFLKCTAVSILPASETIGLCLVAHRDGAWVAEVGPGDMLVVPSFWFHRFHHMETLEQSVSVNVWSDAPEHALLNHM